MYATGLDWLKVLIIALLQNLNQKQICDKNESVFLFFSHYYKPIIVYGLILSTRCIIPTLLYRRMK